MNNETQLAKWREDAQKVWNEQNRAHWVNMSGFDNYSAGYTRAKQENEQFMKLAKFGAMVIRDPSKGSIDKRDLLQYAILADVISPEVEATIKELLNDN